MSPLPSRLATSVAAAFLLSLLAPLVAADNIQNDVVATGNGTVVAGSSTTVNYRITSNNGDGQNGCNAADTTPATVTIHAPAAVVANPASLSFSTCAVPGGTPNAKPVSFSSSTVGNYTITVSVSDAGVGTYNPNPAAFTLRVVAPADTTAPTIVASVSPAAASTGWHNLATGAPTVTFTCSDAGSGIASCGPNSTRGEGADQTVTGIAKDRAGNQASAEVEVDVDLTAPSIVAHVSPAASGSGWHNLATGAPTVSFDCSDDLSGIAECSPDVVLGEGADQTIEGTAVDAAGNSRSVQVVLDVDLTAPRIDAVLSPDGWYNASTGAPTVSFSCSDDLSGLASCPAGVLLGEGQDQSVNGTAHDVAGNSASAESGPFDVDVTPPSIVASLSPAAAGSGWYNLATGAPTASFECSDALSGVASCPASVLLGEGEDQSASGTAYDVAGNQESASSEPADIDLTKPSISASLSPEAPASGWYNASTGAPTATFSCSDGLSGIASCSGPMLLAEGNDSSVQGSAVDVAGNEDTASAVADIDLTAPSIIASVSHPASASGWYDLAAGAPTVSFDCSDGLSGIASCSASVTLGEGEGQLVVGEAIDAAGNRATIEAGPFDVDLTPPSISADLSPDGWYNASTGAPTASFSCFDALSGLASCPAGVLLGEGADQVIQGTAFDVAGNSNSTQSGPFDVDLTAPSIVGSLSPAPAGSGWYNLATGAPTASFVCDDALSGVASCTSPVVLEEGVDQSADGSALDVAGNENSTSTEPADIDLTKPTIEASLSPDPAGSGWYNIATGAPTASFACDDALSGIASCTDPVLLGEGADQSAQGTAVDAAGNEEKASSEPADIDLTAPSIDASLSPDPAPSGWYNLATGAPSASFQCSDALSGIATCPAGLVLGEGAAQSHQGTASDVAGNEADATAGPADIDLTAPTIEASLSPAPAASGWYNLATGAPTASFVCDDALSGIASCSASSVLGEGLAQSQQGFALDVAGNGANATAGPADIDLTRPVLSLPANFTVVASGVGGGPASFSASATDNLDAAPDVVCSAASGALFAPGATIVSCEATDEAGNKATGSFKVTVRFDAVGFHQPAADALNSVKAGSTVPLKFTLRSASGALIGDLAAVGAFSVKSVACAPLLPDPIEFVTTGGTSLRYDATAGQFIQNWKTPASKGCVRASVTLVDGTVLSALFQLK